MSEVSKQFELRQLLKAYRKGLISDELFAEQACEIQAGEEGRQAPPPTPAKTYRVKDRTFATEREMLIYFVDEFRAGETFGGRVFGLWTQAASDPTVRGGLRVIGEREAAHGRLLAARLAEIGGEPRASLPESFREAAERRLGSREVSDGEKIADFNRRLPDAEAAVKPIRDAIAQIEEDRETCSLLSSILEDELATVRWFHAMGTAMARSEPVAASRGEATGAPQAAAVRSGNGAA